MKRNIIFILVLFLISSITILAQENKTVSSGTNGNYLVRPGDRIIGTVAGEDDFDFDFTIDDNGSFDLPFVKKTIIAKCRTARDIEKEVVKHYSVYLRDPMISVVVKRRKLPPITVSGEINRPQQIDLESKKSASLLEILKISGGEKETAGGKVSVFRTQFSECSGEDEQNNWKKDANNETVHPYRIYSLTGINKGEKESNPMIYPGDIVVVERALPVYFVGEVLKKEGIFIRENGLSLTQAIAMVGGTQATANTKDIKIYRMKGNNPRDRKEISINLKLIKEGEAKDVMLEPYDIIDVEKKKKSMARTVFEVITGVGRNVVQSVSTGGVYRIVY